MTRRSIRLCDQEVDTPGHICAFFTSREEEYETLIPYFAQGVEEGEDVLNVLDASRVRRHREQLAAAGLPVDDGRITIASSEDTYLQGGRFDMERMVNFVRDRLIESADVGRCARTAGWMDWLQREVPGSERVMEYEARMNLLVPTFDCTFVCVYDLSQLNGRTVADIIATHPYVILRGRIRENPFYIPPEVYLKTLLRDGSRQEVRTA